MEPPSFAPSGLQTVRAAPGSDAFLVLPQPSGTPPLHYHWSRAGASLDDRFTVSDDAGGVRLTVSAARTGDSGVYTLQASNAAGSDTTRVRLEVSPDEAPTGEDPPTFLRRLQDLTVKVGTRTRFLVEIVSSTECKVTWYRNERRLMEAERVALAKDGNFWCADVAAVSVDDAGRWTCTAENAGGRASCSAHLNVLVPKAYKRPEFVEELRALLTEQGTVSLECKVVGVPTPVLRWFKDSREIKAGDVFALTANAEDPTSLGTYTCEAVNCMGRAYSSSKVHVVGRGSREGSSRPGSSGMTPEPPPIFTKELEDQFVRVCEPLTLGCHVVVPPWPRSVVWYNKEGKVEPSERYHVIEDGVGGYLLEVPSAEWPDEGEWKCVATSAGGRVGISTCYITMEVPKNYRKPRFMENLQAVLTEEGLVSFECKVVGFPTPVLSWFKDGQELKPGDVYQLTGTNSLGSYCCIARNCMGQASSSAELTVEDIQNQLNEEEKLQLFSKNQAPKFVQGLKSVEAKIDEPFRFTIKVAIPPEPSVLWYRDEQPVDESPRCHHGKEDRGVFFLDIQNLEFLDQAEWKCVAMNDFGHSVTSCFLKLIIPRHYKKPRFLENLQAVLSDEGAVNLECKVIGVPQPVLKWYKDGEELKPGDIHRIISGQDGTCCLGIYTCEAQNCMGIAASSASLLGFDDSMKAKAKKAEEQALQRNLSLSTIHEERTSQMYDTPVGDITLDDKGEISFSFDGKEVSVSLYETPDLTEEEALQIVEMYADQLSENVTEHNVVELPPLRFVKETSTSGNLLMEAIIIDVSPEYFASPEEDLRTEADVEDISIADENGPPQLSLDQDIDVGGEDYLEKTMALLSEEKSDIPMKFGRKKSDSQRSGDDYFSLSREQSISEEKRDDDTQAISESELQSFASARSSGKLKSKSSKPSGEDGQESSEPTKTIMFKGEAKKSIDSEPEHPVVRPRRERRSSRGSRRSSSGSDKSLSKSKDELVRIKTEVEPPSETDAKPTKPVMTDEEFKTKMINVSSSLSKIINDIQLIERDIILKSELMSSAATASRSLEIISSLITPLSEIHSVADAAKDSVSESREVISTIFNSLPQSLKALYQSLTIIEKCIDVESDNKTLVKRTCVAFIETCGTEMQNFISEITSVTAKDYLLTDDKILSGIDSLTTEMTTVINYSADTIKTKNLLNQASEILVDEPSLEAQHLRNTQKAVFELKSPLNSLLCIVESADSGNLTDLAKVKNSDVILNDMSASIQDLQTALEQIESLSVKESNSLLQKYNTEIIETVMESVLKLRSSFEKLSTETKIEEDKTLLKQTLITIKYNLSEISSQIGTIECNVGRFDILQSDNKLDVLQKMAQILIALENNLSRLEAMPEVKTHMDVFHKNLTKVLENVIESNDSKKYFTLMEICDAVNRVNTAIKSIDVENVLPLASLSNTIRIIKDNFIKNVFESELNCSIMSNIADVLVGIQEALNNAEEISIQIESEHIQDMPTQAVENVKANVIVEHIDQTIAAINTIKSIECTQELILSVAPTLENICPILEDLKRSVACIRPSGVEQEEHISDLSDVSIAENIANPLCELNQNIIVLNRFIVENIESLKENSDVLLALAEPLHELHTTLEILQQDVISQYDEDLSPYEVSINMASAIQSLQNCVIMVQEQAVVEGADDMSTLEDISGIKTTADTIPSDRLVLPVAEEIAVEQSLPPLFNEIPASATAQALQTLNEHIIVLQNPEIIDALDTLSEVSDYSSLKSIALSLGELHTGLEGILHPVLIEDSNDFIDQSTISKLTAIAEPMQELQQSLSVLDSNNIPVYENILELPAEKIHSVFQSISDFKKNLDTCIYVLFPAMEAADNAIEVSNKIASLRDVCDQLKYLIESTTDTPCDEVKAVAETVDSLLDATDVSKSIKIEQIKCITEELYEKILTYQEQMIQFTSRSSEELAQEAKLIQIIDEVENNIAVLEQYDFVNLSRASDITSCMSPQLAMEVESESLLQIEDIVENAVNLVSAQETPIEDLIFVEDFFKTCRNHFTILRCLIAKASSHKKIIRLLHEFNSLQTTINYFNTKRFDLKLSDDVNGSLETFYIYADDCLQNIRISLAKIVNSQSDLLFETPMSKLETSAEMLNKMLESKSDTQLADIVNSFVNIIEVAKPCMGNIKTDIIKELQQESAINLKPEEKYLVNRIEEFLTLIEHQINSSILDEETKEVLTELLNCIEKHQDYKDATGTSKSLILLKCLSNCTDILQNKVAENKDQPKMVTTKYMLEEGKLKEVLTEMLEPLQALHSQLVSVQEQVLSGIEEDSISIDITSTESLMLAMTEIHKDIVQQMELEKSTVDNEEISLIMEVDKEIQSIQNSIKSIENVQAVEVVKEITKPMEDIEKSLHTILSAEKCSGENKDKLSIDVNSNIDSLENALERFINIEIDLLVTSGLHDIDVNESIQTAVELNSLLTLSPEELTCPKVVEIKSEKITSLKNILCKFDWLNTDEYLKDKNDVEVEKLKRVFLTTYQLVAELDRVDKKLATNNLRYFEKEEKAPEILQHIDQYIELIEIVEEISAVIKIEDIKETVDIARELRDSIIATESVETEINEELLGKVRVEQAQMAHKLQRALSALQVQVLDSAQELAPALSTDVLQRIAKVTAQLQADLIAVTGVHIAVQAPTELVTETINTMEDLYKHDITEITATEKGEQIDLDKVNIVEKASPSVLTSVTTTEEENSTIDNARLSTLMEQIEQELLKESVTTEIAEDIAIIGEVTEPVSQIDAMSTDLDGAIQTKYESPKAVFEKLIQHIDEYVSEDVAEVVSELSHAVNVEELKQSVNIAKELRQVIAAAELTEKIETCDELPFEMDEEQVKLVQQLQIALSTLQSEKLEGLRELAPSINKDVLQKLAEITEQLNTDLVTVMTAQQVVLQAPSDTTQAENTASPSALQSETVIIEELLYKVGPTEQGTAQVAVQEDNNSLSQELKADVAVLSMPEFAAVDIVNSTSFETPENVKEQIVETKTTKVTVEEGTNALKVDTVDSIKCDEPSILELSEKDEKDISVPDSTEKSVGSPAIHDDVISSEVTTGENVMPLVQDTEDDTAEGLVAEHVVTKEGVESPVIETFDNIQDNDVSVENTIENEFVANTRLTTAITTQVTIEETAEPLVQDVTGQSAETLIAEQVATVENVEPTFLELTNIIEERDVPASEIIKTESYATVGQAKVITTEVTIAEDAKPLVQDLDSETALTSVVEQIALVECQEPSESELLVKIEEKNNLTQDKIGRETVTDLEKTAVVTTKITTVENVETMEHETDGKTADVLIVEQSAAVKIIETSVLELPEKADTSSAQGTIKADTCIAIDLTTALITDITIQEDVEPQVPGIKDETSEAVESTEHLVEPSPVTTIIVSTQDAVEKDINIATDQISAISTEVTESIASESVQDSNDENANLLTDRPGSISIMEQTSAVEVIEPHLIDISRPTDIDAHMVVDVLDSVTVDVLVTAVSESTEISDETIPNEAVMVESVTGSQDTATVQALENAEEPRGKATIETLVQNIDAYLSDDIVQVVNELAVTINIDDLKKSVNMATELRAIIAVLEASESAVNDSYTYSTVPNYLNVEHLRVAQQLLNSLSTLQVHIIDNSQELSAEIGKDALQRVAVVASHLSEDLAAIITCLVQQIPVEMTKDLQDSTKTDIMEITEHATNKTTEIVETEAAEVKAAFVEECAKLVEESKEVNIVPEEKNLNKEGTEIVEAEGKNDYIETTEEFVDCSSDLFVDARETVTPEQTESIAAEVDTVYKDTKPLDKYDNFFASEFGVKEECITSEIITVAQQEIINNAQNDSHLLEIVNVTDAKITELKEDKLAAQSVATGNDTELLLLQDAAVTIHSGHMEPDVEKSQNAPELTPAAHHRLAQHIEEFIANEIIEIVDEISSLTSTEELKESVTAAKRLHECIAAIETNANMEETTLTTKDTCAEQVHLAQKLQVALSTLHARVLDSAEIIAPVVAPEALHRVSEIITQLQEDLATTTITNVSEFVKIDAGKIEDPPENNSMKQLESLLHEVSDKINLSIANKDAEDTESLRDTLDEVQTVIIKLKRDYDGATNDSLNETLEDLECSVRSVQLQINEDSPQELLKEACATLQLLVNNMNEFQEVQVSETIPKVTNMEMIIDKCSTETGETLQLLDVASKIDTNDQSNLKNIVAGLTNLKDTIKSLKESFMSDAEILIEKGIDLIQTLDKMEDKVFTLEKEIDAEVNLPVDTRDSIITAVHSVYASISNMRSTISSIQKRYMFENYGKPSEILLRSIKNIGIISTIDEEVNKTDWKKISKSLRNVLNHFEDIKFYINLDKTARLPSDAAFTKIILDELKINISNLNISHIVRLDSEVTKKVNNTIRCIQNKLIRIESQSTLEVKAKIPIFKEISTQVLDFTDSIKIVLLNPKIKDKYSIGESEELSPELLLPENIITQEENLDELHIISKKDELVTITESMPQMIEVSDSKGRDKDFELESEPSTSTDIPSIDINEGKCLEQQKEPMDSQVAELNVEQNSADIVKEITTETMTKPVEEVNIIKHELDKSDVVTETVEGGLLCEAHVTRVIHDIKIALETEDSGNKQLEESEPKLEEKTKGDNETQSTSNLENLSIGLIEKCGVVAIAQSKDLINLEQIDLETKTNIVAGQVVQEAKNLGTSQKIKIGSVIQEPKAESSLNEDSSDDILQENFQKDKNEKKKGKKTQTDTPSKKENEDKQGTECKQNEEEKTVLEKEKLQSERKHQEEEKQEQEIQIQKEKAAEIAKSECEKQEAAPVKENVTHESQKQLAEQTPIQEQDNEISQRDKIEKKQTKEDETHLNKNAVNERNNITAIKQKEENSGLSDAKSTEVKDQEKTVRKQEEEACIEKAAEKKEQDEHLKQKEAIAKKDAELKQKEEACFKNDKEKVEMKEEEKTKQEAEQRNEELLREKDKEAADKIKGEAEIKQNELSQQKERKAVKEAEIKQKEEARVKKEKKAAKKKDQDERLKQEEAKAKKDSELKQKEEARFKNDKEEVKNKEQEEEKAKQVTEQRSEELLRQKDKESADKVQEEAEIKQKELLRQKEKEAADKDIEEAEIKHKEVARMKKKDAEKKEQDENLKPAERQVKEDAELKHNEELLRQKERETAQKAKKEIEIKQKEEARIKQDKEKSEKEEQEGLKQEEEKAKQDTEKKSEEFFQQKEKPVEEAKIKQKEARVKKEKKTAKKKEQDERLKQEEALAKKDAELKQKKDKMLNQMEREAADKEEVEIKEKEEARIKKEEAEKKEQDERLKQAEKQAKEEAELKQNEGFLRQKEKEAADKAKEEAEIKEKEEARIKKEMAEKKEQDERLKQAEKQAKEDAELKQNEELLRQKEKEAADKAKNEAEVKEKEDARIKKEKAEKKEQDERLKQAEKQAKEEAELKQNEGLLRQKEKEAAEKAKEEAEIKEKEEARIKKKMAEKKEQDERLKQAEKQAKEDAELKHNEELLRQKEKEAADKANEEAEIKEKEEARIKKEKAEKKEQDERLKQAEKQAKEDAELKHNEELLRKKEKEAADKAKEEAEIKEKEEARIKKEKAEKKEQDERLKQAEKQAKEDAELKQNEGLLRQKEKEAADKAKEEADIKGKEEARIKKEKSEKKEQDERLKQAEKQAKEDAELKRTEELLRQKEKEVADKAKEEAEIKEKDEARIKQEKAEKKEQDERLKQAEKQAMEEAELKQNEELLRQKEKEATDKAKEEAEVKEKEKARIKKEEAEKKEQDERMKQAEKQAKEDAELKHNEELLRQKEKEAADKAKEEAEVKEKEEARIKQEMAEKKEQDERLKQAEKQAKEDAELKRTEELLRQKEKEVADKAKEEAEIKEKDEARIKQEKAEKKEQDERLKQAEKQAKEEAELKQNEELLRQKEKEAADKAKEEAEVKEKEEARIKQEKAEKKEQDERLKQADKQAKEDAKLKQNEELLRQKEKEAADKAKEEAEVKEKEEARIKQEKAEKKEQDERLKQADKQAKEDAKLKQNEELLRQKEKEAAEKANEEMKHKKNRIKNDKEENEKEEPERLKPHEIKARQDAEHKSQELLQQKEKEAAEKAEIKQKDEASIINKKKAAKKKDQDDRLKQEEKARKDAELKQKEDKSLLRMETEAAEKAKEVVETKQKEEASKQDIEEAAKKEQKEIKAAEEAGIKQKEEILVKKEKKAFKKKNDDHLKQDEARIKKENEETVKKEQEEDNIEKGSDLKHKEAELLQLKDKEVAEQAREESKIKQKAGPRDIKEETEKREQDERLKKDNVDEDTKQDVRSNKDVPTKEIVQLEKEGKPSEVENKKSEEAIIKKSVESKLEKKTLSKKKSKGEEETNLKKEIENPDKSEQEIKAKHQESTRDREKDKEEKQILSEDMLKSEEHIMCAKQHKVDRDGNKDQIARTYVEETSIKKKNGDIINDDYLRKINDHERQQPVSQEKVFSMEESQQHYIKEYQYEPSSKQKTDDKEIPKFIDHSHTDYTMEFVRPPGYRERTFDTDRPSADTVRDHLGKNTTIFKAHTLVLDAQLRSSAPPYPDTSKNSESIDRRSEFRHRSKALSEARSILSEKRTVPRDIKRKPVFSTYLTDRTAVEGSRVKLTCSVLSSTDPTVIWYRNGVLLDNKLKYRTKFMDGLITIEVLNAIPSDSAEYSCTVENENGSVSTSANLKVYPSFEASPIPPTFTRSIRDMYHLAENELVLECRIRGQPLPTITWLKDDRPISSNERFQAYYLADGVCRLAIESPTPDDSGKYTCKAENSVWSDQITHVVNFTGKESHLSPNFATIEKSRFNRQALESRRPHFTNVLADYKVTKGGTIGLQVEIRGAPTRVEWLREGLSVTEIYRNAKTFVEKELYTLSLSDVTEKESGMYTCRAWSCQGNVDMNAAITVVQPNELDGKPAIIVGRPEKDILISVGEDVNISFRIQGEPKPKVVFMKGIRDITTSQRVCKMTSDDYVKFTLKRSVVSDAGTYCILARNAYGCDRAFVTVVVRQRASSENLISDWTYPTDDSALSISERKYKSVPDRIPGEPTVVDSGNNWVSLAWPKPDSQNTAPVLAYKIEGWLMGKEGGARWVELGITPLNSYDAFNLKQGEEYHFRVTPRNRYGLGESVQTSSPVGVGLAGDRPEFVEILPGQLKVLAGETANLSCSVKGKPTPEVVWMKNGHDIEEEDTRVRVSYNGFNCCLTIKDIKIEDEARYSCEATNTHGRSSTYARLAVVTDRQIWEADAKLKRERSADVEGEYPPQYTMRLRDRRVQTTYPVRLTCQVVGSPHPTVTWFKDGEQVTFDSRRIKYQDELFHTLEIAPTTLEDGGVYEALARNTCGAVSCRCSLVVDKGIRAYVAPEFCCGLEPLYRLMNGEELRISAVVEAYPSVGVTWYRDGVRLRSSRRAVMTLDRDGQIELALAAVTPRDAGVYTCTASNEVGRASTSGKVQVIGDQMVEKRTPAVVISSDVPYSKEPMFVRKPRSSEAREGDTVIIQCEVVGDPKPDVYWLRDFLKPDYYRDATHFKRVGAGPEYRFEIPHAKLDYTGAYSVVARNVHGEAKAIISLQILAKDLTSSDEAHNIRYGRVEVIPLFDRELTDLLTYDGDAIEFECRVSGNPEPDIRWFHYNELIRGCPDFESSFDDGTARLKIKQVTAEDEGTYSCEASNSLGKATSSACLVVYPPGEPNTLSQRLRRPPALMSAASTPRSTPRSTPARSVSRTPGPDTRRQCSPSRQMAPAFYTYPFNKVIEEGDNLVFKCAVKGLPAPWATWDKDGVIITPSARITIREKDEIMRILEIEQVTIQDVGIYRITVENDYGRAESSARLEVITQEGKFYGGLRSYSASPRKSLTYRRRPSLTRQD